MLLTAVAQTVCPAPFGQQGAQPSGVQSAESEASQTEGAVVEVQTEPAEQQDDDGPVGPLQAHS